MSIKKKFINIITLLVIAFMMNVFGDICSKDVSAYTITEGKVTIDISDYDESVGWIPKQVKTAKISVDFGSEIVSGKKIKVTLPEGIRYVSYPAVNPATSGELAKIETAATGTFASLLNDSTSASATTPSPYSYTNEIVYEMKDGSEKAEINVLLTVDEYLYYGPKTFSGAEAIKVSAEKAGSSIGEAKMDVKAINGGSFSFGIDNVFPSATVEKGSNKLVDLKALNFYRPGFLYPTAYYYNKATLNFYYPGGNDVEVANITTDCKNETISHDSSIGHIKVECTSNLSNQINNILGLRFSTLLNTSALDVGEYINTNKSYYELEAYDGTIFKTSEVFALPKITVIEDPDEIININGANMGYYDDIGEDYQTAMPYTITNNLGGAKEDFLLEITPGKNMEAKEIVLPNQVLSVKYKTNKSSEYISLSVDQLIKANQPNNNFYSLNSRTVSLADDEYFTNVIVSLDRLEEGYYSSVASNTSPGYTNLNQRVLASLKDNIDSEEIILKTYRLDEKNEIINETLIEKTITLKRSELTAAFSRTIPNTAIVAGESKRVTASLSGSTFLYSKGLGMINPAIYLRLPDGVSIPKDSVAVSILGKEVDYSVSDVYTLSNGDKYFEIDIDHVLGGYFNDSLAYSNMIVSFDIKTSIMAKGNYVWSDYAFLYDKSGMTQAGSYGAALAPIIDKNDINQNGRTDDKILPFTANDYILVAKEDLLIDTYIKESKTAERNEAYEANKSSTAVQFTPGTEAAYYVEVYNNRKDAEGVKAKLKSWIPVPKEGLDFGSDFQDKPGYWNMKLGSVQPVIKVYDIDPLTGVETDVTDSKAGNYRLEYSTDASNASNYEEASYSNTLKQDATMIRLTNDVGIEMQEKAVIEFIYVVDETANSVIGTDKLGKINDFRPYYYFNSAGSAGYSQGTRVGADLVIGEISGLVFKDVNTDGLYKSDDDSTIRDIEVTLFKMDENGDYQPYIDPNTSVQAKVKSDSDGKYKFTNLPNGRYKIDFSSVISSGGVFTPKNVGNDFKIDSDVDQAGDLIGTAYAIDPTKDSSKFIYAGLLEYNPPVDLKLSANKTSITVLGPLDGTGELNSTTVIAKIEPTFFETVADKKYDEDGIKVVSNAESKATVKANGVLTDKGTYLETPVVITGVSEGNAKVTISIQDVYGTVKTVDIDVIVKKNSQPVISASDVVMKAGDSEFKGLVSLASINDAEDGSTGLSVSVKSDDNFDINKPGEYTIVYESNADSDGNKALNKTIKVKVEALTIAGYVFEDKNYNSKNDDSSFIENIKVSLINRDTNAVIATTKTDDKGLYKFSLPDGSETVTNYAIIVDELEGYILANSKAEQADSESIIDLKSKKSEAYKIAGIDYTNKNIGLAKDVSASIAPTTMKIYVGDTITTSISVTNGSVISENINNSNIGVVAKGSAGYDITGVSSGKSILTVSFSDGYNRNIINKTAEITILALPTVSGGSLAMTKGDMKDSGLSFTPDDGIITYSSSAASKVSVDNTGKLNALKTGVAIINGKIVTNDTGAKEAVGNMVAAVGENKNPVIQKAKTKATIAYEIIYAEDFALTYNEASKMNDVMLSTKANSWVSEVFDDWSVVDRDINDIVVDSSAINLSQVPEDGSKIFTVTFTGPNGIASETVNVVVAGKDSEVDLKNGEGISAKDFNINVSQIAGLSDNKVISLANAKAWNLVDDSAVTITSVDYSSIDASKVPDNGVKSFNVKFSTKAGTSKTVKVYVAGKNVVINDDEAINAKGFSLKASEVKGLNAAKVIKLAGAKAWKISDNTNVVITKVDYSAIKAENGTYKVTFSTDKNTSITIDVVVKGKTKLPDTGNEYFAMSVVLGLIGIIGLGIRTKYCNL